MLNSIEHYEWRYAVKKFDPAKKVSEKDLKHLLESLRLAPSSFGLQPWKFLVVTDPKLRAELQPHAWNQTQTTEASHLIVLCGLARMEDVYVKKYIAQIAAERNVSPDSLNTLENMILGFIRKQTPDQHAAWIDRQVYIALGFLMAECAHMRIDSCPMEGFNGAKFNEILNLSAQNLRCVVLCSVGYRAADDKYSAQKKIRFPSSEVISYKH